MGRGSAGMQPTCNTIWPIESARCQVSSRAAWPAKCHQVIYYLTQIPHLHVGISRLGRGHDAVVIELKRDKGPAPYLPTEGGCHRRNGLVRWGSVGEEKVAEPQVEPIPKTTPSYHVVII